MNRRTFLNLTASSVALATAGVGSKAFGQQALRLGTSPVGSVGYVIAVGISQLLQEYQDISSTVEPVGGSVASVFSLQAGKIDIALTNAIAAVDGFAGADRFEDPVDLGLLALGQSSYRQIVVRNGSGITSPSDLQGRTIIGRRPALPEVEQITNAMLRAYGVDPANVNIVATAETNEAVDALNIGTVDAAIIPGGARASYLQNLASEGKISFLQIPQDRANSMLPDIHPALSVTMLPANMYAGQGEAIAVFDVPVYLVASMSMTKDIGHRVLAAVFDHFDDFQTFHATAREWRLPTSDIKIPLHPGAVSYLQENGQWDDDLRAQNDALMTGVQG